jgi:hypothetical protein
MSVFSSRVRSLVILTLIVSTSLLLSSCVSELTGKEGNLTFFYVTDDEPLDFNKPITVNGRLELGVRDAAERDRSPIELTSAESSDPSVLEVVSFTDDTLTLQGNGDGSAEISVEAQFANTGETKPDAIDMRAATPDRVELWHECRPKSEAMGIYQKGTDFRVPFDLKLDDDNDVIGYGYYPVDFSPAGLMTLDEEQQSQTWLFINGADTAGSGMISSQLDSSSLDVELVAIADFDGIERASDRKIRLNEDPSILHRPTVASVPVCQSKADFSVGNLTPDICDARRATNVEDVADTFYTGTGWVRIEPRERGECRYEVNYPDANGGQGVTETLSVDIIDAR